MLFKILCPLSLTWALSTCIISYPLFNHHQTVSLPCITGYLLCDRYRKIPRPVWVPLSALVRLFIQPLTAELAQLNSHISTQALFGAFYSLISPLHWAAEVILLKKLWYELKLKKGAIKHEMSCSWTVRTLENKKWKTKEKRVCFTLITILYARCYYRNHWIVFFAFVYYQYIYIFFFTNLWTFKILCEWNQNWILSFNNKKRITNRTVVLFFFIIFALYKEISVYLFGCFFCFLCSAYWLTSSLWQHWCITTDNRSLFVICCLLCLTWEETCTHRGNREKSLGHVDPDSRRLKIDFNASAYWISSNVQHETWFTAVVWCSNWFNINFV